MISKTLARRLKRLEVEMLPPEEDVLVIQIVLVSWEGELARNGLEFRVSIRRRPVNKQQARRI